MEELLTYILDICSYEKYDYDKLIKLLIEEKDLASYVQEVKFKRFGSLGMYIPNDKKLMFNLNSIIRRAYFRYYNIMENYKIEYERLATIFILQAILHELAHVEQTKMADSSSDDTLHKVIREGLELGRRSPKKLRLNEKMLYKFHYHKVLTERSAEITSTAELMKYRVYGIFNPSELRYLKNVLLQLVKQGYEKDGCPCEKYYSLRNKLDEYASLDFFDKDYSLLTRLSWGFPVDEKTINDEELTMKLLK